MEALGRKQGPRNSGPQLSRGDFGLLLLGLLARREMYGYELVAELRGVTSGTIDLPEGTVYPASGAWSGTGSSRGTGWIRRRVPATALLRAHRQR